MPGVVPELLEVLVPVVVIGFGCRIFFAFLRQVLR